MLGAGSLLVNGYDVANLGLAVGTWPGFLDSPSRILRPVPLDGRDGGVLSTLETSASVREFQVLGVLLQASVAETRTAWNKLKARLDQGLLELVFGDEPTLRIYAYCTAARLRINEMQFSAPGGQAELSLMALNPYRESIEPNIAALDQSPRPIVTGTGPSTGVIQLRAATDPIITYRDQSGRIRAQMALEATIGSDEYVDINMQTAGMTRVAGGVRTNAISLLSAGAFFAVEARDADMENAAWPTLEVSSGTGVFLYRRTWV